MENQVYPPGIPTPPYSGPPVDGNVGVYLAQPVNLPTQQPVYQYNPQQPQVVHTVSQVVVGQPLPTDIPGQMVCPHCHNSIMTRTKHINGMLTWLICGILAVFLCWPCCIIPFFVDSCKDVEHSCPNCNNIVHIHKQMK